MAVSDIKVKISAIASGFDETINKVQSSLDKLKATGDGAGSSAMKWGQRFTDAGKALMPASIAAGALTGATVKLGSEYQKQMGAVQAISGATSKEMDVLKKTAMSATQGTKFSAIEAGQAYEYMGMAGWKSGQMVDGLKPILNLATAANTDLGTTSDIVTDSLTAFGLKAKDTGMFTDVLAAASTNANTNVELMGETFKYAGPVAGALGYSIQDVALATGLMANAGIKGSQAGTTLRSAITNLASPTSAAAKTMQSLGIQTVDANGKMLPFRKVLDNLRTSFQSLTKEGQAQAAQTLFGKEAMSGMLAIINASDEDYKKLANSIDNSTGAAEKMAKTMSDSDPIAKATAQIKNAFISVGAIIMPVVGKIASSIGKLAEAFQKLPAPIKAGMAGIVGIVAVAGPLLLIIGQILGFIGSLSSAASALGVSVGALAGGIGGVVLVIAGVIAAGYLLYKNWDLIKQKASEVASVVSNVWNGLCSFLSSIWQGIATVLTTIWTAISTTAMTIWTALSTFLTPIFNVIAEVWGTIWGAISTVLLTVWGAIKEVATTIFSAVVEVLTTIWDAISEVWTTVWSAISEVLTTIWSALCTLVSTIFTPVVAFLTPIWNAVSSAWGSAWNAVKTILTTIWNVLSAYATAKFNAIKAIITAVWSAVSSTTSAVWNGIKTILTAVWNGIKTMVSNTWNTIKTIISTAWNVIKTLTAGVWNAIKALLTGNFSAIKGIATSTFNSIKTIVSNAWNSIKSLTSSTWNAIKSMVMNVLNAIKLTFVNIFNGIKSAATSGMNGVKSAIVGGMNAARSAVAGMVGGFISVGRNIVSGIAKGIISGIGGVINAAVSAVRRAVAAAKSAMGIHSPSKVMAKEVGRWIPAGVAVGIKANTDTLNNEMKNLNSEILNNLLPQSDYVISPNYDVEKLQNVENNTDVNNTYTFNLKLGNRHFKAFAKDIRDINDRELDLIEYMPI